MQKISPAQARKNIRAKGRREARAREAAERAKKKLEEVMVQLGVESPFGYKAFLRPLATTIRAQMLYTWAGWEVGLGKGNYNDYFVARHPRWGEWAIEANSAYVRSRLKEAGYDV
jgi:hypothetical protein